MKRSAFISIASVTVFVIVCVACLFRADIFPAHRDTTTDLHDGSEFEIHFIDVGQADAALVKCDGRYMLIDGGNRADSSLIYTYLEKQGTDSLDIVVATHAHEDHIGGLSGALSYADVDTVLCPVTEYDSEVFDDFSKWVSHRNAVITVPQVNDSYELGSAEIRILGCNSTDDTNNSSIVLKIIYGDTSFLFTGDAEYDAEKVILDAGCDLSATVLKVGHHGSNTSTSYRFLNEIMPKYAVISVGENNEYGHPHDEPLSRLRDADVTIYRTDICGDIICTSDGKKVTFITDTSNETSSYEDTSEQKYILNVNNKKFHIAGCSNANKISESNKEIFNGTANTLISRGYTAAKCCN